MRTQAIAALVLLVLFSLLTGCATYTKVNSGPHRFSAFSFETPIDWSQRKGKPTVWTVDGEGLEFMLIFEGIADGEKLFGALLDEQASVFDVAMRPTDIIAAFNSSFELAFGVGYVEITKITPAQFGPWEGFRFDFVFESRVGVAMRATSVGTIANDRLHLLVYAGAKDHYFYKYKPFVEQMFSSITGG